MRVPWLVVLAIGVGTFLLRFSFLFLFERLGEVPARFERGLRFVPAAVLSALVLPAVLAPGGAPAVVGNFRLFAAGMAIVVAVRTGSIFWTIVAGLGALGALRLVI